MGEATDIRSWLDRLNSTVNNIDKKQDVAIVMLKAHKDHCQERHHELDRRVEKTEAEVKVHGENIQELRRVDTGFQSSTKAVLTMIGASATIATLITFLMRQIGG